MVKYQALDLYGTMQSIEFVLVCSKSSVFSRSDLLFAGMQLVNKLLLFLRSDHTGCKNRR